MSRPMPRGGGSAQGCGGCPGPCRGAGGVCVSQHAPRQIPPPQQTATAADGTHPTGMHSCFNSKNPFLTKYRQGQYDDAEK